MAPAHGWRAQAPRASPSLCDCVTERWSRRRARRHAGTATRYTSRRHAGTCTSAACGASAARLSYRRRSSLSLQLPALVITRNCVVKKAASLSYRCFNGASRAVRRPKSAGVNWRQQRAFPRVCVSWRQQRAFLQVCVSESSRQSACTTAGPCPRRPVHTRCSPRRPCGAACAPRIGRA
jgi:hypothetical protein